jgi:thiamine biosynthesis lipoprotein ApbE
MSRRVVVATLALAAAGAALTFWYLPRPRLYASHFENVLGTSMDVKVLATSVDAAGRATDAVLAEIDREAAILSGYDPASEFSRWFATRDTAVAVSSELFDVLHGFDVWRERTRGALDPSAETASRVWKAAVSSGHVPATHDLTTAVLAMQRPHWRLDAVGRTAVHLDDAPMVLNSFTKSFIVDRAAASGLAAGGIHGIVVNVGGDLVVRGRWREPVGITNPAANADNAPPLDRLIVHDRAVATSGGYRRGFDIAGVHYSHIVDPRTAWPTGHVLSATVVAPDAADAGALATAFCVLTPRESEQLAAVVPDAEFLLVLADGSRIESAGWPALRAPATRPAFVSSPVATLFAADQSAWKTDYELTVSLEIAQQSMRANRPYVAVWIEDKDHVPVRTLAVWYLPREGKFLRDLKSWYRSDRLRSQAQGTEILGSISSATRAPGRYTLTWNGKDNAGTLVKSGTYTVYIEAAREHGTYQILRQEMDFSGVAKKIDLAGNIEVAAASLDYHRVGGR